MTPATKAPKAGLIRLSSACVALAQQWLLEQGLHKPSREHVPQEGLQAECWGLVAETG